MLSDSSPKESSGQLAPEQWLLLALAFAPDGRFSPIQAQKTMFLLSMEAKDYVGSGFYKFKPYLYGPYSHQLASDLEKMRREGKVIADGSPFSRVSYVLAPQGAEEAKGLRASADPKVLEFLHRTVGWVKSQTFSGLLASIYKKYPFYATQSIFKR